MSKTKKCLITILVAVAALCMAIALGAGCISSKGYEVKFVTGDHAAVSSVRVESGEVITLPTPEEEDGYVFKGWYLAEDYSGSQYSASASYTVTENTTFYGKYNILAPLNLNLDGGTLEGSSFSLEEGENVSSYINQLIPEKARHQFDYWADASGNAVSSTLTMPAEGLTLTAVYKVEVSVEVWVWNGDGSATHYPEYDMIDYASVGDTPVELKFPTVPTGLTMSSDQGTDGTYILSKVDSDPDKNAVKIYYDAGTLTWSCNTNYPSGTGLSSTVCASGTVAFGETVELPDDLTCYGYLLLGWAFTPGAATPEYSVDVVTPYLMIWDEKEGAYLLSGEAVVPATYRPEESSSTLYAVWSRGYVDMFGSYDVVYDTDNGDGTVYLCRGGVFWESETYSAASNSYTFRNSYSNESIYVVRLRSDGYFVFYDRSRALETRYLVEYTYSGNGNSLAFTISDTEYFYYTAYDTVEYIANGYSMGVAEYGYDDEGYVVLNFTSGEMSGEVMTVYLVQVTYSDGSTRDGYIVRNEKEADQKITFGGVGYSDGLGGFKGYMDEDSYYISLTGFNICTYYSGSTAYSYYYWLEGDVFTLFYSDYSYAGEYHYSSELKRWVYYYSALDKTFDIYGADGTTVIGSVTLDGMYDGTITTTNENGETTTEEVIFYVSSYVIGSVVVIYSNPDSAGNYWRNSAEYLYTYSYGEEGYTYFLQKLPGTYIESYYFDSSSMALSSYQVFVIEGSEEDPEKGAITLYLYGYSSYAGYYVYFSVWTGDYEIKTDGTYGFDYYVVTNIQVTEEASYYGITTYYGSMLYEDLIEMTEVAFVPTTFYVTSSNGLYTYLYDSNIWYYIVSLSDDDESGAGEDGEGEYAESATDEWESSDEPATEKEELYKEYTGRFEITLPQKEEDTGDPTTLSGEVSLIVINDYLVYAVMTYDATECSESGSEETLSLSGYIYSATNYRDKDYEIFTIYTLYLTFTLGVGENATTYYWTPLVEFGTGDEGKDVFTVVKEIPYYVFSYVMESDGQGAEAGRQSDEYFTYDLLASSGEREVTYVKGESTYKGTISTYTDTEGRTSTPTGYTLYKFEGTSGTNQTENSMSLIFIVRGYGSSSEGYFPVFILYDENARVKYTGSDGSTFETDGVGLGAAYTTGETTYSVSSYVIVDSEELIGEYGGGAYDAGYIELYANGTYYILDLVDKTSASEGTPGYDYTTRGQEYWYTFFVVDNQILKDYLVTLDGYGGIEVWFYDEAAGAYVAKGKGEYTITDTIVSYSWSYTGETAGAGTTYTAEGEIDGYSGYYAIIYVNHSEFESTLVDSSDFSVLVMDGYGYATRYLTDGYIEYGYYTVLDESYLYYESVSGDAGMVIRYNFEKGTMLPAKYSGEDTIYYTNDMTGSVYLTKTGLLTFNSENYYYYVMVGDTIYVYYIPGDAPSVNGYGYAKSNAISLNTDGTITLGGTTYTKVSIGDTLSFNRGASDSGKYGYLTSSSSGEQVQYDLGTIRFTTGGAEFAATGTITLTLSGASTTGTVYVYREYNEETGAYIMYMAMYSDIFGSYYDYFIYDITVDLGSGTYTVTSMKFYLLAFGGDYLYCEYLANVYYTYYYYAYMYYLAGYGDVYYQLAYEYYNSYYYYAYLAQYYYSYMYLIWDYDGNGDVAGMYATGYFLPYLLSDTEGNYIFFYMEEVEETSSGYYIEFEGLDGYTYSLTFLMDSEFMYYFGYYAFVTVAFQGYEVYETEHNDNEDYYEVTAGYLLFSDYYEASGYLWSMGLTKYSYDQDAEEYVGEEVSGLAILEINGNLYFVHTEYDEDTGEYTSTTYYKIVFTYDEETGETSVEVSIFGGVTSYTTESGHLDLFTETCTGDGDPGETFNEIVLVCVETYEGENGNKKLTGRVYYYVTKCEYNESTSGYTVTLSDGSVYSVALNDTDCSATMELVSSGDAEDETEDNNDGISEKKSGEGNALSYAG